MNARDCNSPKFMEAQPHQHPRLPHSAGSEATSAPGGSCSINGLVNPQHLRSSSTGNTTGLDGDLRANRAITFLPRQRPSSAVFTPIVFVVDDDISIRESIELLIAHHGWRPELLGSAREFLARPRPHCPSCLVLNVSLPDLNGLELQKRIRDERTETPIIFMTGCGDIPMAVRAMKGGAIEFLTKPVPSEVLSEAIENALRHSRASLDEHARIQAFRDRHQSLTPREREVMTLVAQGLLNKQVARDLGIADVTVKAHRGRLMRKMHARSVTELINMASLLGLDTRGQAGGVMLRQPGSYFGAVKGT